MRYPLVSCVVVSNRPELKDEIVTIITNQNYPNIETIYHSTVGSKLTLGEERNIAISKCTGEYVAIFDDDDYSTPSRISTQMGWLQRHNADVCSLSRVTLKLLNGSEIESHWRYYWEGTILCRLEILKRFPYKKRNNKEDSNIAYLWRDTKNISIDSPHLYTYNQTLSNTSGTNHWDDMVKRARNAKIMSNGGN